MQLKFASPVTLARFWASCLQKFAPKEHTHGKASITDFPTALKNPMTLTVKAEGSEVQAYNGAEAKAIEFVAGLGVTITSDNETGKITIVANSTPINAGTTEANAQQVASVWIKLND